MEEYNLAMVIRILQVSIAPVVLISGVGLIILSQTNRMAQIITRIRELIASNDPEKTGRNNPQVQLLYKRSKMVRMSIISLLMCIFFDALVIIDIFASSIFGYAHGMPATILFSISLLFLIIGLASFILDVNMNLRAVKLEIDTRMNEKNACPVTGEANPRLRP